MGRQSTVSLSGLRMTVVLAAAAMFVAAPATPIMWNPDPVLSPDVLLAARALYGTDRMSVFAASNDAFAAAFPQFTLYVVKEGGRIPAITHAMAYSAALGAYDVTREFNDVFAFAPGAATASDAVRYARAYAELANVEQQPDREVVDSSDSSWLGRTAASPTAARQLDGSWVVTLSTWSRENGVLADWTIRMALRSVSTAEWRTSAVGVGPAAGSFEAAPFRVGVVLRNAYAPSHALTGWLATPEGNAPLLIGEAALQTGWVAVVTRPNHDGSTWVVEHPDRYTPRPGDVDLARAIADGAQRSYREQVAYNRGPAGVSACSTPNPGANWGFYSEDPNCLLEVHMLDPLAFVCIACIIWGEDVHIYMWVESYEVVQAYGWYLGTTKEDFALTVIGHEHFHNLQYAINMWYGRWNAYVEGQARFSQTLIEPRIEHDDPTSLYWDPWSNGVNGYMASASWAMCDHTYDLAIYWGHLYARDGGIDVIRRTLEEIPTALGGPAVPGFQFGPDCDGNLAEAIDLALATVPGAHDTHAAAMADFNVALHDKSFAWAPPLGGAAVDWSTHLNDVESWDLGSGTNYLYTGAWGHRFNGVSATPPYTLTCVAGSGWHVRVYQGNQWTSWDCGARTFNAPVQIGAARLAPTAGELQVTVT